MIASIKFAVVSGKLVIQCDSGQCEKLAAELQRSIDSSSSLRRRGDVTTREAGDVAELTVEIECGPVVGGYRPWDLLRFSRPIVRELGGAVRDFEIFEPVTKDLDLAAKLPETIADLEARADDVNVPLAARKAIAKQLPRLREHLRSLQQ